MFVLRKNFFLSWLEMKVKRANAQEGITNKQIIQYTISLYD